jgi:hypothetical protein
MLCAAQRGGGQAADLPKANQGESFYYLSYFFIRNPMQISSDYFRSKAS